MPSNTHKQSYLLDTNIILRFLLGDHPRYSEEAKGIFEDIAKGKAIGYINHVTLAETFFVLTKVYDIPQEEVVEKLLLLIQLNNIKIPRRRMLLHILELLHKKKTSFVDAYNLFYAINKKAQLKTFDTSLKRMYAKLRKD